LISNHEDDDAFEDIHTESSNFNSWGAFDLRKAVIFSTILERPYK
jgi:hypothetical protein